MQLHTCADKMSKPQSLLCCHCFLNCCSLLRAVAVAGGHLTLICRNIGGRGAGVSAVACGVASAVPRPHSDLPAVPGAFAPLSPVSPREVHSVGPCDAPVLSPPPVELALEPREAVVVPVAVPLALPAVALAVPLAGQVGRPVPGRHLPGLNSSADQKEYPECDLHLAIELEATTQVTPCPQS